MPFVLLLEDFKVTPDGEEILEAHTRRDVGIRFSAVCEDGQEADFARLKQRKERAYGLSGLSNGFSFGFISFFLRIFSAGSVRLVYFRSE